MQCTHRTFFGEHFCFVIIGITNSDNTDLFLPPPPPTNNFLSTRKFTTRYIQANYVYLFYTDLRFQKYFPQILCQFLETHQQEKSINSDILVLFLGGGGNSLPPLTVFKRHLSAITTNYLFRLFTKNGSNRIA